MHFPGPNPNGDDERPPHPITRWRVDATSLVYAVLDAADRIQAARTRDGHPLIRDDRAWRLLNGLDRRDLRTACRIVRAVEQGILRWMGDRLGPPLTD
jgi:hypothetical protein